MSRSTPLCLLAASGLMRDWDSWPRMNWRWAVPCVEAVFVSYPYERMCGSAHSNFPSHARCLPNMLACSIRQRSLREFAMTAKAAARATTAKFDIPSNQRGEEQAGQAAPPAAGSAGSGSQSGDGDGDDVDGDGDVEEEFRMRQSTGALALCGCAWAGPEHASMAACWGREQGVLAWHPSSQAFVCSQAQTGGQPRLHHSRSLSYISKQLSWEGIV